MPVTTPPPDTVATEPDVPHVPPDAVLDKLTGLPMHTSDVPDMVPALGAGNMPTVADETAVPQTLVTEYRTASLPMETADNKPVLATDATLPVDEVLHTPPVTVTLNVPVVPMHTVDGPLTVPATGIGVTVSVCVATALPQKLVTV